MSLQNVLIFGDSYSTFSGYIPEGYAVYYTDTGHENTDVSRVTETWWHSLLAETDSKLILNDSWSGSTIGYTGYNNSDCSGTSSFIYRLRRMKKEGFFEQNTVHTVFVFGGTNDSWSNAPLGEMKYADWQEKDLYQVLPAICCFLKTLKDTLPEARIVCLINCDLKPEIMEGLKQAGAYYQIQTVQLENIHKANGHPTIQGMQEIKTQILAKIK